MNILQAVKEALESLSANKLRSGLTMLGIIIGVAAVIAMISLGRGVEASVNDQLAGVGSTLITLFAMPDREVRNPQPLTLSDAEALMDAAHFPEVQAVAAEINLNASVSFGTVNTATSILGVTANYKDVQNLHLNEGDFIHEEQVLGQSAVAVLGARAAKTLFEREAGIVGETIRIDGQPYRVIGVLRSRGSGGLSFTQTDNAVLIPITTAKLRLAPERVRGEVDLITVQVRSASQIKAVSERITETLRIRHNIPVGLSDVTVFVQKDVLDALNQITSILTVFLGGIAAISLLVGGIGIMNIMLVSVSERTREIGLRKAVGARRRDILMQFLTESVLLSLVGGMLGILTGWMIGAVIQLISTQSGSPIRFALNVDAILLATITSSAIGIFFGLYPANRAAGLTPVEALRSE
ncbi:ABC transporter permease [Anaerolinea thermophila]|uniref:ABC transporter permease protein n=1 Tax=Anaerolinea thermophila (strain DSM 14523 / JCM 11388 / NBRC 100420 / UNI-1) TaxID=926569 RepID=E8N397_ANATU|nr:ABC transporter permease [Anaerolinea thermophila]BAJ62911.1 putative ABC transporter permease protein [Anaerolinea thermophila UNI-1]